MNKFKCVLFAGLLAIAAAAQNAPANGADAGQPHYNWQARRVIGVQQHEIAESSPFASATIAATGATQNTYKVGSPINIRFTITNISDQTISFDLHSRDKKYFRKGITFLDARDGNGNLAPETEAGCVSHFFSSCHTEYYPKFGNPRRWRIMEPNATVVDDYSRLDIDYKISPGEYTVVGYLCGMNEGPECIKSNAIKITVQ